MSTPHNFQVGDILEGTYRLDALLGEGGFAQVFRASHLRIASLSVAVKVLRPEHIQRGDIAQRFEAEARTTASLRSRHTVRVTDFGVTSGAPFLVMEYIEGSTLDGLLRARGHLSDLEAGRIAVDVLKSLDEAHSLGIIHRDLKPANIFIVDEPGEALPVAKVLDFGIAKLVDPSGGGAQSAQLTAAGIVYCTPQYAAPEVLNGAPEFASDLYALGHAMAEMLDGVAPYADTSAIRSAAHHLNAEAPPFGRRTRQSALFEIVARATEKDTASRYRTAREMLLALEPVVARLAAAGRTPVEGTSPLALGAATAHHGAVGAATLDQRGVAAATVPELPLRPPPAAPAPSRTMRLFVPSAVVVVGVLGYLGSSQLRDDPPSGYLSPTPSPAATASAVPASGYLAPAEPPAGYLNAAPTSAGYLAPEADTTGYLNPATVSATAPTVAAPTDAAATDVAPTGAAATSAPASPQPTASPAREPKPERPRSEPNTPAADPPAAATTEAPAANTPRPTTYAPATQQAPSYFDRDAGGGNYFGR